MNTTAILRPPLRPQCLPCTPLNIPDTQLTRAGALLLACPFCWTQLAIAEALNLHYCFFLCNTATQNKATIVSCTTTTTWRMHPPPRFHWSCIQPLPGSCSSPRSRAGASGTGPRSAQTPGKWASGLRWRRSRHGLSWCGRAAIASPNANGSATTMGGRGSDPAPRPRRLRPQRQPRLLIRIPLPPS